MARLRAGWVKIYNINKNCDYCPLSLFQVKRLSWIQVLNCQNCNPCLKCHKSAELNCVACERTLPHTIQNAAPVERKNPATGSNKMWFTYAPWRDVSAYALEKNNFAKQISLHHLVDIKLWSVLIFWCTKRSQVWQLLATIFDNF